MSAKTYKPWVSLQQRNELQGWFIDGFTETSQKKWQELKGQAQMQPQDDSAYDWELASTENHLLARFPWQRLSATKVIDVRQLNEASETEETCGSCRHKMPNWCLDDDGDIDDVFYTCAFPPEKEIDLETDTCTSFEHEEGIEK